MVIVIYLNYKYGKNGGPLSMKCGLLCCRVSVANLISVESSDDMYVDKLHVHTHFLQQIFAMYFDISKQIMFVDMTN